MVQELDLVCVLIGPEMVWKCNMEWRVSKGEGGREARLQLHSHVPGLPRELFLGPLPTRERGERSEEIGKISGSGILGGGNAGVVAADVRAAHGIVSFAARKGFGIASVFARHSKDVGWG